MGALPKPNVPDGPIRLLSDELHALHHRAGWPSLREMAKEVGCSHTTVSVAFSDPRVPRWGLLELIIEALGGDTASFHRYWLAASHAEQGGPVAEPRRASPPPPASPPPLSPAPAPVPRALPADVAGFTGRAEQLTELDELLARAAELAPAVVISAISGTAGVGKTALAVRWAHRVADRFPDGQLYANLRGYDPDKPVQPAEALAAFLRDLGLDSAAIPYALAERSARFRTLLAGRRMLVLLDNVQSVDQIRDLLPGTASCLVLVTSRDTLPALVARHGAVRVTLGLLPLAEATALLRTLIGPRVDAEPEQAEALAKCSARLPLALRIAAELAASRPGARLADLVDELGDERRRLDLLAAGDDEFTAPRAVFSWSYRRLTADAAHAFRLLGVHPGRDIDGYALAALAGTDLPAARRLLDVLARAHLIEPTRPGRYGMHDLLRAYAAELAAEVDEPGRHEALIRLFDHYLSAASAAIGVAFPNSRQRPVPARPAPVLGTAPQAREWLDAHWPNLLATARAAHDRSPAHAARLAVTLAPYLDVRAHYQNALDLHGLAVTAARADGDRAGEAATLTLLGTTHRRLGRYHEALDHYRRALDIHRAVSDPAGEAAALHGMGVVDWRLGRYADALEHLGRALEIYRAAGDRAAEGAALGSLGIVNRRLGRYAAAVDHYERALVIQREIGDRAGEGAALGNLGIVHSRLGRYDEALAHYRRALDVQREIGDRAGEAIALTNVGAAHANLGRYAEAVGCHRRALEICRRLGYRVGEGDARYGLGVAHARAGHTEQALDDLRQAVAIGREIGEADLETGALNELGGALRRAGQAGAALDCYAGARVLASRIGDRYEEARAVDGIARLRHDAGDTEEADRHWRRALSIYADLGVPEADRVRERLTATG